MDKLKDMASKIGGSSSSGGSADSSSGGSANAGKEDYVDKGLDYVEKQTGTTQSRETNEMMTDKARDMFEKQTGKEVPDKVSN